MPKKLTYAVQRHILRLRKKDGLSLTAIASITGVSLHSVASICKLGRVRRPDEPRDGEERISLGVGRCLTCGGWVDLPCRACEVRRLMKKGGLIHNDEKL